MGYKEEVAGRLYVAFEERRGAARLRRERFGQKQLADGIAKIVGGDPPAQSVVSRWMAKENPSLPENPALKAAATVLGVREMWLLFGDGPMREPATPAATPEPVALPPIEEEELPLHDTSHRQPRVVGADRLHPTPPRNAAKGSRSPSRRKR
jgi:hypothetical protein